MAELGMDLLDNIDAVRAAVVQVSKDWLRYWEACHSAIHEWEDGYIHW